MSGTAMPSALPSQRLTQRKHRKEKAMPHINTNFTDVPDKMPPISAGTYLAEITKAPDVRPSKKGDSMNVVVEMKLIVENNPALNGRLVTDFINLGKSAEAKLRSDIKLKNLCNSAGIMVGATGVDTEELAGKRVKVQVRPRTYEADDGSEQQGTQVVAYVV